MQTSKLEKIRSHVHKGEIVPFDLNTQSWWDIIGKIISPDPKGTESQGLFHKTSIMGKVRPKR